MLNYNDYAVPSKMYLDNTQEVAYVLVEFFINIYDTVSDSTLLDCSNNNK